MKTKIFVSILIIAIIVIAVMGALLYKLNNEKAEKEKKVTELQTQVEELNKTVNTLQGKLDSISDIVDSKDSSKSSSKKSDNNAENEDDKKDELVLDGHYSVPESDSGWDFTKDGKVASNSNSTILVGTYKFKDKNTVVASYTKNIHWNDITNQKEVNTISLSDTFYVDDDKNVSIINQDGSKTKLGRYGDAVEENFE